MSKSSYSSVTNLIGTGLEKTSFLSRHNPIGNPKTEQRYLSGNFSKMSLSA